MALYPGTIGKSGKANKIETIYGYFGQHIKADLGTNDFSAVLLTNGTKNLNSDYFERAVIPYDAPYTVTVTIKKSDDYVVRNSSLNSAQDTVEVVHLNAGDTCILLSAGTQQTRFITKIS